jgi:hypothetical protein
MPAMHESAILERMAHFVWVSVRNVAWCIVQVVQSVVAKLLAFGDGDGDGDD